MAIIGPPGLYLGTPINVNIQPTTPSALGQLEGD